MAEQPGEAHPGLAQDRRACDPRVACDYRDLGTDRPLDHRSAGWERAEKI
jgi:hypothetical protein